MLNIKKEEEDIIPKLRLKQIVGDWFQKKYKKSYSVKEFVRSLGVTSEKCRERVREMIDELHAEQFLKMVSPGRFRYNLPGRLVTGVVELTRNGSAFVYSENCRNKILVAFDKLHHALQGDVVEVFLNEGKTMPYGIGEVVRILKRKREVFVGMFQASDFFAFVKPTGEQLPYDIYIPQSGINGAKTGEKVKVKVTAWPKGKRNPVGVVMEVLGRPGNSLTEMNAIMAEFDLPLSFPPNLQRSMARRQPKIITEEILNRKDFRAYPTFTIDPIGACDFDDALSIQKTEDGLWEVGIHISDVSFYVKPGTLLDKEAYKRSRSVYLAGRMIPMLPELLCKDICSLCPGKERLTFSVVLKMTDKAEIQEAWYGRSVIRSDYRFTYEEVQSILDGKEGVFRLELLQLNKLAGRLREFRLKNGAFNFKRSEIRFDWGPNAYPRRIWKEESSEAHSLVEEFMLLANRQVAETVGKLATAGKKRFFIYRVHNEPSADRMLMFKHWVKRLGYTLKLGDKEESRRALAELLKRVKGSDNEQQIEALMLRTMSKAFYSTNNTGHYALCCDFYTHFTSPIRRYSDILVHRLFLRYLEGKSAVGYEKYWEICRHLSAQELQAVKAERASVRYKQLQYLMRKQQEAFKGRITEITRWGFYVEIEEIGCEGFVAITDMEDDYYQYNERDYRIEGRHFCRLYRLGDTVEVKVRKINLTNRFLDLLLAGDYEKMEKLDKTELPVKAKCKKRKGRKKCRVR